MKKGAGVVFEGSTYCSYSKTASASEMSPTNKLLEKNGLDYGQACLGICGSKIYLT
jgi:hypothetical protein